MQLDASDFMFSLSMSFNLIYLWQDVLFLKDLKVGPIISLELF